VTDVDGRLLALFELTAEDADTHLAPLGLDGDELTAALERLGLSANPLLALRCAVHLAESDRDGWRRLLAADDCLRRLAFLSGASDTLPELIVRSSEARDVLCGDLQPRSVEEVRGEADAALANNDDAATALATVQRLGMLRIALRDVLGVVDTPTATAELSALAEGVIAAGLDHARADEHPLAVVAMGKLGGRELNYVSDVDLLFVARSADDDAVATVRRMLQLFSRVTPEGRVYEIDINLRPEGRDGPLVRSIEAYAAYYERWAKTWEFQALLKARPIAGDPELGRRFVELIEPFVWPERLGDGAVAEIQKMKGVVERSSAVREVGTRQLKLAPGGLRDIEFAVQLLQLVHGRVDASLRTPNTLDGLTALAAGGYIDEGDANLFGDAYQFLRTVEHRLQLRRLRRTHLIPSDNVQRRRLARAVGFRDLSAADALTQFDRELARVQGYVRRLHEKLFYRPLLTRFGELTAREQRQFGQGLNEEAARERLAALGFKAPARAVQHLDALVSGTSRLTRVLRTILPAILPALAASPDPDGGLVGLRTLCERLTHNPTLLYTLRDAPPSGELLVSLFGRSRRIGEWIVRDPDLIGRFGDPAALDEPFDAAAIGIQIDSLLRRSDDPERVAGAIGRRLRRELVWTAVRDLSAHADVEEVTDHLTTVAEAVLEAATRLATDGTDVRLAVIGLGRFGGGELGYASDLDLMVVFDPPDARDEAFEAVERLISLVSLIAPDAPAFTLDLGLRPEGRDGALARTLDAYERYYRRWAQPWEFLALTQARVVAGDRELGAQWQQRVMPYVYQDPPSARRLSEVRTMKARVERERAGTRGGGSGTIDLKLGAGGLSDIEWTVQQLALTYGGNEPDLRVPGTRALLAAARDSGHLDAQRHAWMMEGWRTLTRLRNVLYLIGERNSNRLPSKAETRAHAAQVLGYEPPGIQQLDEHLRRTMRRVRAVHEQVFY
jgi:glutamate-ammonia-ligase adenylyltransferase